MVNYDAMLGIKFVQFVPTNWFMKFEIDKEDGEREYKLLTV